MKILLQSSAAIFLIILNQAAFAVEYPELSKCTWPKDWGEELKCFKGLHDTKMAELDKVVSTLNTGLRSGKLVKKVNDDQREWVISTDEECTVDYSNIPGLVEKDIRVKIKYYACKYVKARERIEELSGYPYVNITCFGNYPPTETISLDGKCSYLNDLDVRKMLPSCPDNSDNCLCGQRVQDINSYVPEGMKIVAACGVLQKRAPFRTPRNFEGSVYLTGEYVVEGTFMLDEWGDGEFISLIVPVSDSEYHEDYILVESDYSVLRLGDQREAITKFKVPEKRASCITAKAKIKVVEIEVVSSENEYEGAWVLDYEVLETGEFSPCPPKS